MSASQRQKKWEIFLMYTFQRAILAEQHLKLVDPQAKKIWMISAKTIQLPCFGKECPCVSEHSPYSSWPIQVQSFAGMDPKCEQKTCENEQKRTKNRGEDISSCLSNYSSLEFVASDILISHQYTWLPLSVVIGPQGMGSHNMTPSPDKTMDCRCLSPRQGCSFGDIRYITSP